MASRYRLLEKVKVAAAQARCARGYPQIGIEGRPTGSLRTMRHPRLTKVVAKKYSVDLDRL